MRILHLTDLHYNNTGKKAVVQETVIDKIVSNLTAEKIDFVLFTGDLVNKGNSLEDFFSAEKIFLSKIQDKLGIKKENIFVAPGNHDVFRNVELDDVKQAIDNLESNDDLNNYVTKNQKQSLVASLKNLNHYYQFAKNFYEKHVSECSDLLVDDMYSTHIRQFDGKSIGITILNSAWRCSSSKTDYGNLKFPVHYLRLALKEVSQCDFRILLMHHPIADFTYWNGNKLEDLIHKDYHMMFTGHTHRKKDTIHLNGSIGIYHCSSRASLCFEDDGQIGYTIIDTSLEDYKLKIKTVNYDKTSEEFLEPKNIEAEIPVDDEKKMLNKLRETLKKRFYEFSREADKLFLSYKEQNEQNNFIELFTKPILKTESQSKLSNKKAKTIQLEEVIRSDKNHLIIGKDKSGKSAILYKAFLDFIRNFNELRLIPLYIDCKHNITTNSPLNIEDELPVFLELNRAKSIEQISEHGLVILLDNYSHNFNIILDPLKSFVDKYANIRIISTASETLFNSFSSGADSVFGFENLFIHDITRSEIRALTNKWPNISEDKKEFVLEKINTLFQQLNIPSNYWTVSLFIWIFEKNSNVNFGNNFQLIELYIDNLLDKDNFILSSEYKIDYDDLKEYLAELAHHIVKNHHKDYYLIDYNNLVNFTSGYKDRNKRFVVDLESIIQLIINKGVIKKVQKNNEALYTFRLNGVFEYFIGLYMSIDEVFRNETIDDDNFYLSFGNELEICAGIKVHDKEYVQKIFDKTKAIFSDLNSQYDITKLDSHLKLKIQDKLRIDLGVNEAMKKALSKPISSDQQDELMEAALPSSERLSEVHQKKFYEKIENEVDHFEKALMIFGRVFRNSKLRNQEQLNKEAFDFILNSTCTLGFALIDDIDENKHEISDESVTEEELLKIITEFMPIMAQTFFHEAVVQVNLETIIIEKINQLKQSEEENQFKLLILYFSLLDLNLKEHEHYINEIIDILKISVLKQSSLMKLYLYLSLKCNGNENLQKQLEGYIRKQELSFNNSEGRLKEIDSKIAAIKNSSRGENK